MKRERREFVDLVHLLRGGLLASQAAIEAWLVSVGWHRLEDPSRPPGRWVSPFGIDWSLAGAMPRAAEIVLVGRLSRVGWYAPIRGWGFDQKVCCPPGSWVRIGDSVSNETGDWYSLYDAISKAETKTIDSVVMCSDANLKPVSSKDATRIPLVKDVLLLWPKHASNGITVRDLIAHVFGKEGDPKLRFAMQSLCGLTDYVSSVPSSETFSRRLRPHKGVWYGDMRLESKMGREHVLMWSVSRRR